VPDLIACPFCHELFAKGEAEECPACGLQLEKLQKVSLSHDAMAEDDFGIPRNPHLEPLPWRDLSRAKGALIALGCLGLAAFFVPWVSLTSPVTQQWSGADLARRSGWIWGAMVGWFVMLPVVISRRSIDQMRGARVAAAFLSSVPVITTSVLWLFPPAQHTRYLPIRFSWAWGLYATWMLGVVATTVAVARFGGRIDDIRVSRGKVAGRGETLH
jgi:hypothetical protein